MRNNRGAVSMLSFLDLISCGLGGALLLFLISAIAEPTKKPLEMERTMLVVSRRLSGFHAEVGLQWRPLGSEQWRRGDSNDRESIGVSVPSSRDAGGEAILVIHDPPADIIEVQPYLRTFPDKDQDKTTLDVGGCQVRLDVFGQGMVLEHPIPKPIEMTWPGRTGQIARVRVRPQTRRP